MKNTQIFLLHFAGGNRYSYSFLTTMLIDFDVVSLELPGRGERSNESLLDDFDLAIHDIYEQIIKKMHSTSFFLYGHSLGASIMFRVSKLLENAGKNPACLFLSGYLGPVKALEKRRYWDDHDIIERIRSLGGMPEPIFESKEMMDYLMPIFRADFKIVEKSKLQPEIISYAPIFVMMGNKEDNVEEIANWRKFSYSEFRYKIFDGGHFFIYAHARQIAELIKNYYLDIQKRGNI